MLARVNRSGLLAGLVLAAGTVWSPAALLADEPAATASETKPAKSATNTFDIAMIELEGSLDDRSKVIGLGGVPAGVTMRDVLAGLREAGDDADMEAIVIRLKDAELTLANVEELGEVIRQVRAKGKKVSLYAEHYANAEVMLGSYCDEVILQDGGEVTLPGIYMEEMFLADTFKWLGITPSFVQVGDYKGASEMMANSKPSPAWDKNINALLDGLYGNMRRHIKEGRKLSDQQLDAAMEKAWMVDGPAAKKVGLIDAHLDLPELGEHLSANRGEPTFHADVVRDPKKKLEEAAANPFALFSQLFKEPSHKPKRDTIAVLHIDGAIIDGESTGGGMFGGEGEVGSRTIRRALSEIEENDKIKGLIVRVDSPGGSATASEIMWRGVKRVAAKKPVWVSVGHMAASGGYYVAVSGDKIYVNESSIVGSIGVVGGKLALGGAAEKLHVNVVPRSRGPRANLFGAMSPWTETEKGFIREKMTDTYNLFTSRVTAGRPGIELDKTAEGRLFVGSDAVGLKMADEIGSLDKAVTDLAAKQSLATGEYDVMDYPAPKGFAEMLEEMFGGVNASAPRVGRAMGPLAEIAMLAREFLGSSRYNQLVDSLNAMAQLREEPVILVAPRAIIIK